jgi:hypothetical protein
MPRFSLQPVPAPAQPKRGLRFEIGERLVFERHTVIAVTGPSFTVLHEGHRQRYDRAQWHAWLQDLLTLGVVRVEGRLMQQPGPAPLVTALAQPAQPPEVEMDPGTLRPRLDRAVHEVLRTYRIVADPPREGAPQPDGLLHYHLHGGTSTWRVVVDLAGVQPPTCTCPDFVRAVAPPDPPSHACKHILAVLLNDPTLRFQCLDFFL